MIPDDSLALFAPAAAADLSGPMGVAVAFLSPLVPVLLMLLWVVFDAGKEYLKGN